jgi:hypothetical protein
MPQFQFRRGAAEIEKSTQRKGGGSFGKFAPSIYWSGDKEAKYLLFLNPIEDVPRLDMINFIPVKNDKGEQMYFASAIARSDACFGDDAVNPDPLVDKWDAPVKDSNLFVAVELEPVMETKRGREKPVGFSVKTVEFDRRIRDEKGELTDETETVVAPAYGFIQESASNFGAVLGSHDAAEFPIHEWAIKIMRIGTDQNTKYTATGYEDMPIDLSPFVENLDGISYLSDVIDDVKEAVTDLDPEKAIQAIGTVLLEARLNELADEERYNRLADGVTETLDRFGAKKKKGAAKSSRPSQRRSNTATDTDDVPETTSDEAPKRGQSSSEAMSALRELQENAKKRSTAKA